MLTKEQKIIHKTNKKEEILRVATELFYRNGFENTSIEEIIKYTGIAKGTLYYHFTSKMEILENIVDRMAEAVMLHLNPVMESKNDALFKLRKIFEEALKIKMQKFKKEIVLYLEVYYNDSNIVYREKMKQKSLELLNKILSNIIIQGVREGTFKVKHPEETANVITGTLYNFGEEVLKAILKTEDIEAGIKKIQKLKEAYLSSIERILGLPEGSIDIFNYMEGVKEILETYNRERRENAGNRT